MCKWINNLSKSHLVGGFNRPSWTKCCMLIKMAEHHNIIPKLVGISRKTTKHIQNYLQAVGTPPWSHFFSAFIGGEWGIRYRADFWDTKGWGPKQRASNSKKICPGKPTSPTAQDGWAEMIFLFIQTLGINRHILRWWLGCLSSPRKA